MTSRDLAFVSYSHKEKQWLERLQVVLSPYVRYGHLKVWADPYIKTGDRWEREIESALARTKVAVLLVSSNFLDSDFILEKELPPLLEADDRGEVKIACIPITASSYEITPLKHIQWSWSPDEPLDTLEESARNRALVEIAKDLASLITDTEAPDKPQLSVPVAEAPAPRPPTAVERQDGPGRLFGVPVQRPHYIERPDDLRQIKKSLVGEGPPHHQRHGLYGPGGVGKSVLAIAIANDADVRRRFPDGIYWISLSQHADILASLIGLIGRLGANTASLSNVEVCKQVLSELTADLSCLLILDDLWEVADADPFTAIGVQSSLLVTTRDAMLLTALGAAENRIGALSTELSLQLLGQWADQNVDDLPESASAVADQSGDNPLALTLAGARVRDGMSWEDILAALQKGDLEFLDHPFGSIFSSMRVSLDALAPDEAQRFLELAVFPEDTDVPESVIGRLWQRTGQLSPSYVRSLVSSFERKGLLYESRSDQGRMVSFTGLQKDFQRLLVEDATGIHATLLDAYAYALPRTADRHVAWHCLDDSDQYLWTHLAYHLIQASRETELLTLLTDVRYTSRKYFLFGRHAAEADLRDAQAIAPHDEATAALARALTQSSHLLNGHNCAEDLAATLCSRIDNESTARSAEQQLDFVHLRPMWPMPDLPDPSLLRTFGGHSDSIACCAVDSERGWIISGSDDRTLRIWEIDSGELVRTLIGNKHWVTCTAIDPGGNWIVSGSDDHTVHIWDIDSGRQLTTLSSHSGPITDCAVDSSGRRLVTGSRDGSLRVWDTKDWTELHVFELHAGPINCCAIDTMGGAVVAGCDDNHVYMLNPADGNVIGTLEGHSAPVTCCEVDMGGGRIVSGSRDRSVIIWDMATSTAVHRLEGHTASVECVAYDSGRGLVASGSWDGTLHLWDARGGTSIRAISGHSDWINCCALDRVNQRLVSGSWDTTLRIWDYGELVPAGESHDAYGWVTCCGVDQSGERIVTGARDHHVCVWNKSGERLQVLKGPTMPVNCCAIDPRATLVVAGSDDRQLHVWNALTGDHLKTLDGHSDAVNCCAIGMGGKWVVSGSLDRSLRIWDADSGELITDLVGHTGSVSCCHIAPQSDRILSGSDNGELGIWTIEGGSIIHAPKDLSQAINCCAVTPAADMAVWGTDDHLLHMLFIGAQTKEYVLEGHTDVINCCDIDANGRYIASGGDDGSLRIWNAMERTEVLAHRVDGTIRACSWVGDGRQVVATGSRGIYVFDLVGDIA